VIATAGSWLPLVPCQLFGLTNQNLQAPTSHKQHQHASRLPHQSSKLASLGCEPPTFSWQNFYSAAGVKGDTGFDEDIIDYMWTKYKIYMPFRQRAPARTQALFYLTYVYIHFYPTRGQWARVMTTPYTGVLSYSSLHQALVPVMEALNAALNATGGEISWDRRLAFNNHDFLFPFYTTTIVDGFPVEVWEPEHAETKRLLNQGKYNATVLKGEVVISLTGEIVSFSFPHLGIRNDSRVRPKFLCM
jgi:hypothetical protein